MRARIAWGLASFLLVILVGLMTWEPFFAPAPAAPAPRSYSVQITRDEFGVPHVHGKSDPDVAFGIAFAHAEDDFATLQDVAAMTRGRYGAIAGVNGAKVDFAFHLLDARGTVRRRYAALPADTRALLDAYAAGLNTYAAKHPAEIKLARLFPLNGRDIATGFALRQPFFFGLDNVIGALVGDTPLGADNGPALDGKPLPDYEHGGGSLIPAAVDPIARPGPLPIGEDAALAGSNAFAVAPSRSGDGVTRLVSNAHQPYRGGVAWYEIVVESDNGWHMAGALFPGMPFLALGHNEALGWTNTVNRPDLIDTYKLVLDGDGSHYRLDGKWQPLEKLRVWLPVRFGPLVLPVPKTVWRSIHGPVIVNREGAFAIRYAAIDSIANIADYYHLNKARNFAEWQALMAKHPLPSTNFIYADRAGNIAYLYNAAFPVRRPGFDWRRTLPGDRSDLIWHETVRSEQVPHYLNPASGFLYNANNTPFRAAGKGHDLDPAQTSPLLGVELDETNRSRRAGRLMDATNPIGRRDLHAIKYDTGYERTAEVAWMLDGIARLDVRNDPVLSKAQALIGGWDLRADGRNPGDALAVMVLKDAMKTSYQHTVPPDPRAQLEWASSHLMKYFGRLDPPLGRVERLRQGPGKYRIDLPLDGGGDTLRAATSWNVDPKDGRLLIKHGDSFVMFIEWPQDGKVTSRSVQPFGAATTRPDSPHFTDQAPLFAAHRLKPVHFFAADVTAHAVRRYVVSNR
ncbi:penicillin acylase family protein [Novosphingobium sp. Gsoil 351]|uniref:penicillin acylase family protein n=1 Tax=Novosphingobium sp. Gsoil 351 TaxID=2675225 RepID=UPI0012B4CC63|nr:penicillin acylase family protein [Novosphingobium sp. Gsoil 351]QGN55320.1 acylase [Novosphingobium sp. Gsoil 351]